MTGGAVHAAAALQSARVHAQVLLTGIQLGATGLSVDTLLAGAAAAYALGARRVRRRRADGRAWPALRTAAFLGGLSLLFLAVGSGLAAYDDDNFSAHVVQHVLLMMAAPPMIVLGRPLVLAMQATGPRTRGRLRRLVHGGPARRLLARPLPVAAVYFGSMWACLLTPLYRWTVASHLLHDSEHAVLVFTGLAYWQLVVAPGQVGLRRGHLARVAAVLAGMPFETYLGFTLHGLDHSLGPGTTVASVQSGGELFWYLSMLGSGLAFVCVLARWVVADERIVSRLDAADVARSG